MAAAGDYEDEEDALGLALLEEEPFLTFERVDWDCAAGVASFQFHYCGGRRFRATMRLAFPSVDVGGADAAAALGSDRAGVHNALVHIGLCILPWYWMGFNCRHIRVEAAYLRPEQVQFWEEFYQDVLSEFLYLHGIDRDRLKLHVRRPAAEALPVVRDRGLGQAPKVLIPLGGGKDSLVVYQLIERTQTPCAWLHVGDRPLEFQRSWRLRQITQMTAGRTLFGTPFLVEHAMSDPAWEEQVAGNRYEPCGHPWAALVAFDSVLAALAGGFSHVAVGNERSANYGNNVVHEGRVVNHQYDKSFHFERRVHEYIRAFLVQDLHYFSALQHLWEVQIARTFVRRSLQDGSSSNFLRVFLSCNEAVDGDKWCCACAKCAFVFLLLSAWCSPDEMEAVFGENLLDKPSLFPDLRALLASDSGVKPMECVGTASEALLSLHLAAPRFADSAFVASLSPHVVAQGGELRSLLDDYNPEHLVPEFLLATLREPIADFA